MFPRIVEIECLGVEVGRRVEEEVPRKAIVLDVLQPSGGDRHVLRGCQETAGLVGIEAVRRGCLRPDCPLWFAAIDAIDWFHVVKPCVLDQKIPLLTPGRLDRVFDSENGITLYALCLHPHFEREIATDDAPFPVSAQLGFAVLGESL